MKIIRLSKEDKSKDTLEIRERADGSTLYLLTKNVDGYKEVDSLDVPSNVEIIQQK